MKRTFIPLWLDAPLAAVLTLSVIGGVALVARYVLSSQPASPVHEEVHVTPAPAFTGKRPPAPTTIYGAGALRSNLSDKDFCATELGREQHRFASEGVNAYRIYDFYKREALYYLAHPQEKPAQLLPYTELDGGRRGHWGGTNEPDTVALWRTEPEEFSGLTERSKSNLQVVSSGTSKHPAALCFNADSNLREVLLDAKIEAPGTQLLYEAFDILGLSLQAKGNVYLKSNEQEWREGAQYAGHYWNGRRIIYQKYVANTLMLDCPEVFYMGDTAICARHFEWQEKSETLNFELPVANEKAQEVHHEIMAEGALQIQRNGNTLTISGIERGARLHVLSWRGDGALAKELKAKSMLIPSDLTHGGAVRFPEKISVRGKLNVDASMMNTAYRMDDIPVPYDNPWHAPMCLSGIAFDKDGTAFICSLTGDVWHVSGLNETLSKVVWKRYASGLAQPMGIQIVNGEPVLCTAHNIVCLHDLNKDGEADYVEVLNKIKLPGASGGAARNGLGVDGKGVFYFEVNSGIYSLSADGAHLTKLTTEPMRNPLGFAMRADGLCFGDSSEGDDENGACSICESNHPENAASPDKRKRVLFLPRGIDNSPGSRLFLNDKRFGPLGENIIGLSYGSCGHYLIMRDTNEGVPQAALMPLPGDFASGTVQLQANPVDGQLFVVGIDGWGDYAVTEGSLHRLRWTGKPSLVPTSWQAHKNGLLVRFNEEVDVRELKIEDFFAQQWNNRDSMGTYGSPDYSVREPEKIGHDRLTIKDLYVLENKHELFVEIPDLLPAMETQLFGKVESISGHALQLDLYATINRLRTDFGVGALEAAREKPMTLTVPTKENNGNTYENVVNFFDKAAGRDPAARAVAPAVEYKVEDLNYGWLRKNLLDKQCIMCHGQGTQHDYSTYAGLMRKVNVTSPEQSHLFGMVQTKSMPPYPLPSVAPEMQKAVLEWIKKGAPE